MTALGHARAFRIVAARIDDELLRAQLDEKFQLQTGRRCQIVYEACSDAMFRYILLFFVHALPQSQELSIDSVTFGVSLAHAPC